MEDCAFVCYYLHMGKSLMNYGLIGVDTTSYWNGFVKSQNLPLIPDPSRPDPNPMHLIW